MSEATRKTWEEHWDATRKPNSLFGWIASFVRVHVFSRALRHYALRYLRGNGPFLEAGCGSGESSIRLGAIGHPRIGLDFSRTALGTARSIPVFDAFLQGDIRRLPLRDASIGGIWNLGVLEHFDEPTGVRILSELRRVLTPGANAVIFWPPALGSSRLLVVPIEEVLSFLRGKQIRLFPGEVNRLRSLSHARRMLAAAGLEEQTIEFSPRALFIHAVVVARKPA